MYEIAEAVIGENAAKVRIHRTFERILDFTKVTLSTRSYYKAVKKYSKKLQIALANDPIKWYSIHKPAGALFCVLKNRRSEEIINCFDL